MRIVALQEIFLYILYHSEAILNFKQVKMTRRQCRKSVIL